MSAVQHFWNENLPQIFGEIKKNRSVIEPQLQTICHRNTQKSNNAFQDYESCVSKYNNAFSELVLSVEYEQRKVFECMKSLQSQQASSKDIANNCLPGVKDSLEVFKQKYLETTKGYQN